MTTIACILILCIYAVFSFFVNRILIRCRVPIFILISMSYFILTWYYFDFIYFLYNEVLPSKGIYSIDFGHGDIPLFGMLFLCVIGSIINIGIAVAMKEKRDKNR